ncbi:DUF3857 domain-containing protein [Paenimyroides tangerinum]|uniref:DUF3857 domain-containing protein n=1 Tax=Paenimyroides tangerinum TaxID=2488728 RepID=A0A3P3WK06_9FLAO|nr:DUF3857 domain-containing protein [Paenimyroides tangerinum]RRJ93193.1 DUF3857 domain-containing protein [Paenimyroides tangerinum]
MRNLKTKTLLILFFAVVNSMNAQKMEFSKFHFNDTEIVISEEFKNEEEIILEQNIKSEFSFGNSYSNEYYLFHEKKLLNSNIAIERNNKVYIPYTQKEDLIVNKLRVILPNGKKIELKESDIMKDKNEQTGVTYEYFAVNGLEKGAIIERYYILKKPVDVSGETINVQENFPIVNFSLELIYPNYLEFETKSYNGLTDASFNKDKYQDKNSNSLEAKNIPGLNSDEQQSNWIRNVKAVRYKLASNKSKNTSNLYAHKDFVSEFFENYYVDLDSKDKRELEKFTSKLQKSTDPLLNARAIEGLIKENIQYNRYYKLNTNISDILKSKQANLFDLMKLYIAVLNQQNIEHELVFTTEKDKATFDKDFESYENIKEILIYMTEANTFIEPIATNYRTPLIDFNFGNNYGLFVKPKVYQGVKMPVTTTRKIHFADNLNITNMDIIIDASKGIEDASFKSVLEFTGYTASYFQVVKDFVNEIDFENMKQDLASNYAFETSNKPKVTTVNDGVVNLALKPYIVTIEGNAEDIISKAGNNYLVKIGSVIGKQMEMYADKERQLPIEIDYPHFYTRKISMIIPDGYKIKNPEIIKMNHVLTKDGKVVADFISDYKIEGNKLVITNTENYDFEILPVSDYPKYREIINAAADFHKMNLIIEKI